MNDSKAEACIDTVISTEKVEQADIVVGLFSYNSGDLIKLPLTKSYEGLTQTYPNLKGTIVCCDASSQDNTKEVFLSSLSPVPKVYLSTPPGDNSKLHCLFNLMHFAKSLKAKVIVALDGDLASVKRTWINRLSEPILSGNCSLTIPFYHSLKFDTPVTNLLAYPLFRALFGRRIRQPFDTDRAFSGELNESFLAFNRWPAAGTYQAAEMTMDLLAVAKGARICQSFMAAPRMNWQNRPLDLSTGIFFQQVTGSIFDLMEKFPELWLKCTRSRPTAVTGTDLNPTAISPRLISKPELFLTQIKTIVQATADLWSELFNQKFDSFFQSLAGSAEPLSVHTRQWAQLIYESTLIYHKIGQEQRKGLLEALTAVFYARLLTWLREGSTLTMSQMEAQTEEEARTFEAEKQILVNGWNGN
jgi:hypothetical protein